MSVCLPEPSDFFVFCWCSAGHLGVSDVASAGVWTWMAWWSPPKANRGAARFVKGHPTWTLVSWSEWLRRQELHQRHETKMKELQHSLTFLSPTVSTSDVTLSHCALYWTILRCFNGAIPHLIPAQSYSKLWQDDDPEVWTCYLILKHWLHHLHFISTTKIDWGILFIIYFILYKLLLLSVTVIIVYNL